MEKEEMDRVFFDLLHDNLRNIFLDNATRDRTPGSDTSKNTCGLAAAQAAQALIDLHKNFKRKI